MFIDFLAERLPREIERSRLDCGGNCDEVRAKLKQASERSLVTAEVG
jgi:hypothetical protein